MLNANDKSIHAQTYNKVYAYYNKDMYFSCLHKSILWNKWSRFLKKISVFNFCILNTFQFISERVYSKLSKNVYKIQKDICIIYHVY